jgi:putative CocE/NonD family hydrolase
MNMRLSAGLLLFPFFLSAQTRQEEQDFVKANYSKTEQMIRMRDGVSLFTTVYAPLDKGERYPFLMERTPYSCSPYGENRMRRTLGPNPGLMHEKYIFVYQDVRGRYRSEGSFEEMTPAREDRMPGPGIDESTDSFDSIEWLLSHIGNNNGKVGIYGISYPGFYASAALPNAHPAIKAVSPQAPVTDEFIGDDANHNGAFFLLDNFDFTNYFQGTLIDSGRNYKNVFSAAYSDAYRFFLGMGPLNNTNGPLYFDHKAKIWNEYLEHVSYDSYWKERNIRTHLKNVKPAVLVVGGWFDAEDMFGSLRTYEAIEKQSAGNDNRIVMGPWTHGAWAQREWNKFGTYDFRGNLNRFFQDSVETPFFNFYLKGKGRFTLPEATVYETGTGKWVGYTEWPPARSEMTPFYLREKGSLSTNKPVTATGFDEYTSDPANPVPYTEGVFRDRNNGYIVEDQRFASKRPDVLTYQTEILRKDLTLTGRIRADIFLASEGTDADLVVKLIDVLPADEPNFLPGSAKLSADGFQRLVRAEVFRCRFRNSFEIPEALVPGKAAEIAFQINEIAHTFKKGHQIMIQVQSSWFPLVDRNPQQFVNIPGAKPADFKKTQVRIYHDSGHPSAVYLPLLQ